MSIIPPGQLGPLVAIALTFLSAIARIYGELSLNELGSDLSLSALALHFEYIVEKLLHSDNVPIEPNLATLDSFVLIGIICFWLLALTLIKRQIKTNYRIKGLIPIYAFLAATMGALMIIFEILWRSGTWI